MTNYEKLLCEVRNMGMEYKCAVGFVKQLADEEKAFKGTEEDKRWALKRGFYPGRIELYGLNEENYRNYLPDFHYFMMHPLNNHFKIWVNDKLTLKYMLNNSSFMDVMPKYYLYVENDGSYTYLMDCPSDVSKNENFLWNLLQKKQTLAMKPNNGSGGIGFIKLEHWGKDMQENNTLITHERFNSIRESIRNYIVTEYCHQHHDFTKIWEKSECTLRIIMYKLPKQFKSDDDMWKCVVSFARFGTNISGGASNLSSGGVGVGFDFLTGEFDDFSIRYKKYCKDSIWRFNSHPDTKFIWYGYKLPNWSLVKQKIYDICKYLSSLSYLGFDVIITEDGMKLCEINTLPAMGYGQVMCGPALIHKDFCDFCSSKGFLHVNGEDFYNVYMKCQE